jgi:hypothetical protein
MNALNLRKNGCFRHHTRGENVAKTLPIRLNDEQVKRLEEGAALAGHKHISTYVRARLFDQVKEERSQGGVDQWATLERFGFQLDSIERHQALQQTLLAVAVYLLRKSHTQGTLNGLRAELATLGAAHEVIDALLPDLAPEFERLSGDD